MSLDKIRIEAIRYYDRFGLNQMSFDLGFNASDFGNETAIRSFIARIDKEFDLVMVYERLEESLVLLSDLLCWSLEDVVVFRTNTRKEEFKSKLSERTVNHLKEVSKADVLLYEYFERKFQEKVSAYGVDKMAAKVAELREVTDVYFRRCVSGLQKDSSSSRVYNAKYVVLYDAKNESDLVCQRMLRDELKYIDMLREKQSS